MRRAHCLVLLAWPAAAHVMSMSTGELKLDGSQGHFEFRIPLYEVSHVKQPEEVLLANVRFSGARLVSKSCKEDPPTDSYVCNADYTFAAPVEDVAVECTLPSVTVTNHVHLLHVTLVGKRQDAVFDSASTRATIRFRAPGTGEAVVTEAVGGLLRALGGPAQWLILAALALAGHSRRELAILAVAFIAGQCAGALLVPLTGWQPVPRFVEAAAALTVAYLAVEVLLLPKAGARWLIAAALGVFHGLWLLLFIQGTSYRPVLVLTGAAIGQAAVLVALSWAASRVPSPRVAAIVLLVLGLALFCKHTLF